MTTLFLNAKQHGVEIVADLAGTGYPPPEPFQALVRPGESFGGFSYEELLKIATTRGQMDADELRV